MWGLKRNKLPKNLFADNFRKNVYFQKLAIIPTHSKRVCETPKIYWLCYLSWGETEVDLMFSTCNNEAFSQYKDPLELGINYKFLKIQCLVDLHIPI